MSTPLLLVLALVVLALGGALGWSFGSVRRQSLAAECRLQADRVARLEADARESAELAATMAPLRDSLDRLEGQLHDVERARIGSHAALYEQVGLMRRTGEELRAQTGSLVSALRAPQARGQWGEMQLRRVVELAGMLERCDFDEQPSFRTPEGVRRPDLVVRLAGGKSVVVDAKVPLSAYLTAAETQDDAVRAERLQAHARHLRAHVDQLAAKEYWTAVEPSPEMVVLFLPGEAFLAPALTADPELLEHAMRRRVVIATPTTLVAMLRTIAYAWSQDALTDNARDLFEVGRELHKRLSTMGGHMDRLGRSLARSVEHYNATVGTLERGVLSSARRMTTLGVTDADLAAIEPVENLPRPLTAPELVEDLHPGTPLRAVGES